MGSKPETRAMSSLIPIRKILHWEMREQFVPRAGRSQKLHVTENNASDFCARGRHVDSFGIVQESLVAASARREYEHIVVFSSLSSIRIFQFLWFITKVSTTFRSVVGVNRRTRRHTALCLNPVIDTTARKPSSFGNSSCTAVPFGYRKCEHSEECVICLI
uniref:Uncharacterized protein n=1 Tax=Caenorhabditis japonica TaxID=281687 RepID=A0A8R1HQX1_CAEJA